MDPNADFFTKYGSINQDQSILSKSQFLMIRHACSIYNTVSDRVKNEVLEKCPGKTNDIKWKRRQMEMEILGDWEK